MKKKIKGYSDRYWGWGALRKSRSVAYRGQKLTHYIDAFLAVAPDVIDPNDRSGWRALSGCACVVLQGIAKGFQVLCRWLSQFAVMLVLAKDTGGDGSVIETSACPFCSVLRVTNDIPRNENFRVGNRNDACPAIDLPNARIIAQHHEPTMWGQLEHFGEPDMICN